MYIHVKGVVVTGWPVDAPKTFSKAMRDVLGEVAMAWHRKILPLHFRTGAAQKYGYKRRRAKYMKRKRRQRNVGKAPLVYRGTLRKQAKFFPRLTSTQHRARVRMRVPAYVKQRGSVTPGHPAMGEELLKVTPDEANEMGKYAHTRIVEEMMKDRSTRKVRLY